MPMPPNQNPAQATQAAMGQAQQMPMTPVNQLAAKGGQQPQPQAPQKPPKPEGVQAPSKFDGQGDVGAEVMKGLETHLNQLPPDQKAFITGSLQHYPNIVIPFVGIVCGKEVFDYFINIYKQHFAKPGQPGQPPQGQQPQAAPQGQPQQNSASAQQPMPNQGQQAPVPQPQQ